MTVVMWLNAIGEGCLRWLDYRSCRTAPPASNSNLEGFAVGTRTFPWVLLLYASPSHKIYIDSRLDGH
jgi:hypothetical protein